ncbi:MAG TPA: glutamate--tRNA ligase [Candidatus Polarisedimenticolaceae bacterium]
MSSSSRVRFAPSPTGSLHLGNARTALFNWLVARRTGGTFVLRIEDTDTEREQEGSEAGIFEDLRWLGLDWDEGPDRGGPFGPYRQSERGDHYRKATEHLLAGGRSYRCFCSEELLEADRKSHAGYSGRCREIDRADADRRAAAGEPHAVRFRTIPPKPTASDLVIRFQDRLRGEVTFPAVELGDPVLVRRDGRPTYNFAVVVDDLAMGITLVLRGDDHLSNTPRQVLLFRALGGALPDFAHLPMVRGADGERLSKRHGATSVAEFRRMGYPPEALLNALALMGWSPSGDRTIVSVAEMVAEFELDRVGRSPAVFDPAKLSWISGQHVHSFPADRLVREVREALQAAGRLPGGPADQVDRWVEGIAELVRPSIAHFDQVVPRCAAVFLAETFPLTDEARTVLLDPASAGVLAALEGEFAAGEPDTTESWQAARERVKGATGLKGKALFHPVRAALTGDLHGPELDRLVPVIALGARLLPGLVPGLGERVRRARAATA